MSAKPATIYLGTRSHFRRRLKGQDGRYRNLLKIAHSSSKAAAAAAAASAIRRYQNNSKQVKKVKPSKSSSLAKNSGSSTSIKQQEMTTSVLHLPSTSSNAPDKAMASPSSSTSETSERSTPSPNADNEIDWSQHPAIHGRRKSTSSLVNKISNNLVLQQLRVALKKLPAEAHKPMEAVKRRHSDCGLISESSAHELVEIKKAKIHQPRRPLSASLHSKGQGKITEYLPEMKHFIALRKEKLDRVLNLHKDLDFKLASSASLASTEEMPSTSLNDISKKDNESGIETGGSSGNDTASVASSGSRHSVSSGISQDADVFEVPRTIRFPPAAPTKCYSEVVICKWELCGNEFDSTGKLLDHLKSIHAVAENQKEETDSNSDSNGTTSNSIQYKCLWEGCKVYGKGSSSKLWLEKHVMSHGGNKPFQCIVDGCKHRFGTQTLLERHVNNHFKNKQAVPVSTTNLNTEVSSSKSNLVSASRSSASNQSTGGIPSNSKVFRKLIGKKIKYRKTPYSARIFDLFDIGAMAQVRMRLSEYEKKCQDWKSKGFLENPHLQADPVVILHSRIMAKKTDSEGNLLVLQSWTPPNILEDQWIPAKDAVPSKSVNLNSLPLSSRVQVTSQLYQSTKSPTMPRRGRKLKPHPRSTALS